MSKHRRNPVAGIEPLEDRKLLSAVIRISGNAQRIAYSDSTPARADFTDFGPMALTGPITSAIRTYTIKNTGDTNLVLTGARVTLYGSNADQFSFLRKPSGTIGPGKIANFTVKFDPTTAGAKSAFVTVKSVSQKSVYRFYISGEALNTTQVVGGQTHAAKTVAGTGNAAANNMALKMNYTGFRTDGLVFDSSLNAGREPFTFKLGVGGVIVGWDKGFVGTKVGDKVVLFIPANEAYGETGSAPNIPKNAPLIFETETLGIGPSIYAQGANSTRINDGDTTPSTTDGTSFGSTARNSTIVKTFTLFADVSANGASPSLTDTANPIRVTGANASEFSVSSITNGAFTVTFRPSGTGTRTAKIEIPNNNPFDNNYTWVIQGTGT